MIFDATMNRDFLAGRSAGIGLFEVPASFDKDAIAHEVRDVGASRGGQTDAPPEVLAVGAHVHATAPASAKVARSFKPCLILVVGVVEPSGIEPLTSCMPCKRSPS
jgi:hypothetical protein